MACVVHWILDSTVLMKSNMQSTVHSVLFWTQPWSWRPAEQKTIHFIFHVTTVFPDYGWKVWLGNVNAVLPQSKKVCLLFKVIVQSHSCNWGVSLTTCYNTHNITLPQWHAEYMEKWNTKPYYTVFTSLDLFSCTLNVFASLKSIQNSEIMHMWDCI